MGRGADGCAGRAACRAGRLQPPWAPLPPSSPTPPEPTPLYPPTPTAEITLNLSSLRPDIRAEWDELRQHDVLFLLAVRPPDAITANYIAQVCGGVGGWGGGVGG